MSPRLPLEELGSTPRERRLLRRVGVVLAAAIIVGGTAIRVYSWADARLDDVESDAAQLKRYVAEERRARCSIAENVYTLCLMARATCKPVSADCSGGE